MLSTLVFYVGCWTTLYYGARLAHWAWRQFVRPATSYVRWRGRWAVVTGASWGIGYGYAHELARRGLNVVLVARGGDRLREVAAELDAQHGVASKVVVADFSGGAPQDAALAALERAVAGLDVALLVNNVGVATRTATPLLDVSDEDVRRQIDVNCLATVRVTRLLLRQMLARAPRPDAAVVTLASVTAKAPPNGLAVYAATKAFDSVFTRALAQDYAKRGIVFQSATPGFVTSKMTRMRRTSLSVCSERRIANDSLRQLGVADGLGDVEISPYWAHAVLEFLMTFGNGVVNRPLAAYFARFARKQMEKKRARDAAAAAAAAASASGSS